MNRFRAAAAAAVTLAAAAAVAVLVALPAQASQAIPSGGNVYQSTAIAATLRVDTANTLITSADYATVLTVDTTNCNPNNGIFCQVDTSPGTCLSAESNGVTTAPCDTTNSDARQWFGVFGYGRNYYIENTWIDRNVGACTTESFGIYPALNAVDYGDPASWQCTPPDGAAPAQLWYASNNAYTRHRHHHRRA